jgi:hypothetical protein
LEFAEKGGLELALTMIVGIERLEDLVKTLI